MGSLAPLIRVTVLASATAAEGVPATSLEGRVLSMTYEDSERGVDKMTLVLDNGDLELLDKGDDVLGGTFLEVSWGYAGEMSAPRRVVIKGITGFQTLTIEAHGLGVQMHKQERVRAWHGLTRSEVVKLVAEERGFSGALLDLEDSEEPIDTINQLGETDARLMKRLAAEEGFQFWVDDIGLHWRSRAFDLAPSYVFTWRKGVEDRGNIKQCRVESNLLRRVGRAIAVGRDPITKKDLIADGTSENGRRVTIGGEQMVIALDPSIGGGLDNFFGAPAKGGAFEKFLDESFPGTTAADIANATTSVAVSTSKTQSGVKREAAARFRKAERESVKLSIDIEGEPGLRAKAVIEVRGISSMLSGLYYATSCTHSIGDGYSCSLNLIRDAHGFRARSALEKGRAQKGERNRKAALAALTQEEINQLFLNHGAPLAL